MRRHDFKLRLLALALALIGVQAGAQTKVDLFNSVSDPLPLPGLGALAEYLVVLDAAALRGAAAVEINIPGYHHIVVRDGFEARPGGGYRWYGRIDAMNELLITSDGRLVNVYVGGTAGRWTVRPAPLNQHLLVNVDLSFLVPPDEAVEPPPDLPAHWPAEPQRHETTAGTNTPPAEGPVSYIDLLVLYTQGARDGAGGDAQIRNFAQHQIDLSNLAFENSLVSNVRYRLRHAALSTFPDGLHSNDALNTLTNWPALPQMRSTYGADTVFLLSESFSNFVAGIAWVQRTPGPKYAPRALAIVVWGYAANNPTFLHEGGHVLGMEHNPEDLPPTTTASFPWSFGHRTPVAVPAPKEPGFRTIMATGNGGICGTPCTQVSYFSNPDVVFDEPYPGVAAGIADQRDNARTARLVGPGNSAFYPESDVIFAGDLEAMP